MSMRIKDAEDPILRDYKGTGFSKAMKVIALIVCGIYIVFLVYFLFFSVFGLYPWEYVVLLGFAAAPVFLMIATDVLPYVEYNRFRGSLSNAEYQDFLDEYEANKTIAKTKDGIIVNDRIVFFMGRISVPKLSDIVWIYKVSMSGTGKDNIVFLSRLKKFYITVVTSGDSEAILNGYVRIIKQYSSDLMIGDTEENNQKYTEEYEKKKYKPKKK